MKKRIVCLLATLILTISMFGCGTFPGLMKDVLKGDQATSSLAPGAASEPEPSQDAATYEDQYVGVWRTVEVASNGQAFTIEEFEEIAGEELTKQATLTITLNEDGSCEVLNGAGIGGAGIWTASDGEIVIRDAASTFYLTDQGDGSLLLVQENSSHTFRR